MFSFIKELGKVEIEYEYGTPKEEKIAFKSYIKSVEDDYILVDYSTHNNIPEGTPVKATFRSEDGFYTGNSSVIGFEEESIVNGLKIAYPEDVIFIQPREYVRVPLRLKIELVIFYDEYGDNIKTFDIRTLDISGSGLCFVSDLSIGNPHKIAGLISLPSISEEPLEVLLKHVYSRVFIINGKRRYKNAFTFVEIDEKLREKILREILFFQLKLRKRGLN